MTTNCEAKVCANLKWGGFRCKRPAVTQIDGRWACWQHAETRPHGWHDEGAV
jgi:hypothetical protein